MFEFDNKMSTYNTVYTSILHSLYRFKTQFKIIYLAMKLASFVVSSVDYCIDRLVETVCIHDNTAKQSVILSTSLVHTEEEQY